MGIIISDNISDIHQLFNGSSSINVLSKKFIQIDRITSKKIEKIVQTAYMIL